MSDLLPHITAVILTYNEERHLTRCIRSLDGLVDRILVVDSYSTDATVEIATRMGAEVMQHPFRNHADQFNWALDRLGHETEWVFRLDADEIATVGLCREIHHYLPSLDRSVNGVFCRRRIRFQGRTLRWGGMSGTQVLRLFRYGYGRCENRWMDEHIVVSGKTIAWKGEILDENLQPLTWWIQKHNCYASREAIEMLYLDDGGLACYGKRYDPGGIPGAKRRIKNRIYARLPLGLRSLMYFLLRYVFLLGFLDGTSGSIFHVLQGFWYRFLVDVKVYEVKRHMRNHQIPLNQAIWETLGIKIS